MSHFTADNIIIRPICHKDCHALWQILSDPLVQEFNDYPLTISKGDVREHIQGDLERSYTQQGLRYVIVLKQTGLVIGSIGLFNIQHNTAYIGFELASDYFGKGIMQFAITKLLSVLHDQFSFPIENIFADVKLGNLACIRLLEKLGFKKQGLLWCKSLA
ncbi:GNAT family N-acetyltransferase [Pseudoalteromonas mariniglutinosa]|uniref:GNAT family N-acetyltransferase n=1 Tax=Pseudoalteromonas mariniglutinosa TaxID=206042 RepID=UPI00384BA69E